MHHNYMTYVNGKDFLILLSTVCILIAYLRGRSKTPVANVIPYHTFPVCMYFSSDVSYSARTAL